jgi:E3 ubiquitin-protein ligase MYCBP2
MKEVCIMEEDLLKKAMERAKFEDLDKNARLKDPNDRFYNDLRSFAIYKLSYYQCFKCKGPYFGGMKDCE